jgi:hypothetical protein
MPFPHFDREETISEDIGFKGPHFNEPKNYPNPTPYPGHETWSPQQEWGDVGGGGEFTGWKSQEDPPSYRSDWQDYPADEFTGIQSNVPSGGGFLRNIFEKFGGNLGRLGGGLETPYMAPYMAPYVGGNRNLFNPAPGPWNEFDPPSWEQDLDLMAELSGKQGNWMESGLGNPNFYSNFEDYYNSVTGQGDWKQKLGWKDEATEQEVIDKLNQMMEEKDQRLPWPVV